MKSAFCFVCCMATLALTLAIDSDAGHFIPKAFYRIDSDGHKSDVHAVSPHIAHYLRRLRRDSVSSSSSSSSSSNGGPTFFSSQQVVQHTPDVGVASRFGGAPETVGHVVQTTGVIDDSGRIHHDTREYQIGGNPNYNPNYQGTPNYNPNYQGTPNYNQNYQGTPNYNQNYQG